MDDVAAWLISDLFRGSGWLPYCKHFQTASPHESIAYDLLVTTLVFTDADVPIHGRTQFVAHSHQSSHVRIITDDAVN